SHQNTGSNFDTHSENLHGSMHPNRTKGKEKMSFLVKHILETSDHNPIYQHKIKRTNPTKNSINKRHKSYTKIIGSNHEKTVEIPKTRFIIVNRQRITTLDIVFRHIYIIISQKRTNEFRFVNRRKHTDESHQKKNSK